MHHAFQSTDPIGSPWPVAARFFPALARILGGSLIRAIQWRSRLSRQVSVSPVSSDWLLEQEISSSRHKEDA
jgi:hypothetical protein